MPSPVPANEAARLEALRAYRVLDTPPEAPFDRLTTLAARLIGTPICAVSLVDAHRQYFKSCVGLDVRQTPRDVSFCAHTLLEEDVLVVEDALADPRFRRNPLVAQGVLRSYAGAPLRTAGGLCLGSFCVLDPEPRSFHDSDLEVLRTFAAVVVDQLELRLASARQAAALEAAERASAVKHAFLRNLNHEVRTPLAALTGFAELLDAEDLSPEGRTRVCESIRASGARLLGVMSDVLDFADLESGSIELEHEPFVAQRALERCVEQVRPAARDRGVRLRVTAPHESVRVLGDEPRFRQAVDRLLDNAVRFAEAGGAVDVELTSEAGAPGVVDVTLRVENDTREKSALDPERLFDAFCQGDESGTRRVGGLGLGLTISRRLAEAMGGGVDLTREGDTVRATLRLSLPAASGAWRGADERTPAAALRSLRVLVAEDGPDNRLLLRMLLERVGAQVTVAEDGRRAVELAERQPFDLVLMDLQMPVMDGYEATRRLREGGFDGPIVAVTANATDEDRRRCAAGGFDLFLTKPLNRGDLYARCAELARAAA